MAVVGNALVLAAICRNSSLRTPSYIFLAWLALIDFVTGIFGQPFYVVYRAAELTTDRKLYCIANAIAHSVDPYLVVITGLTVTAIAVERWLLISRRRLTTRRVYIIQGVFLLIPIPYMTLRRLPGEEAKGRFEKQESISHITCPAKGLTFKEQTVNS